MLYLIYGLMNIEREFFLERIRSCSCIRLYTRIKMSLGDKQLQQFGLDFNE